MKLRVYKYYETDENGEVLSTEPCFCTLKAEIPVEEVKKFLKVENVTIESEFEYEMVKTEYYDFIRGKADKFSEYFRYYEQRRFDPYLLRRR